MSFNSAFRIPHSAFGHPPAIGGNNATSSPSRSEEHTSELQSHSDLVCRLLLEKKNTAYRHRCLGVRTLGLELLNGSILEAPHKVAMSPRTAEGRNVTAPLSSSPTFPGATPHGG